MSRNSPATRFAPLLLLVLLLLASSAPTHAAGAPRGAAAQANALFDDYWQWRLRERPEMATMLGDHRYDDRLGDESAAGVERRRAALRAFAERARKIDTAALDDNDRVSLAVLRYLLDRSLAIDAFYGDLPFSSTDWWSPVTQQDGPQLFFAHLVRATIFASVRDYENYLKRLDAFPAMIDALIARMQAAMKAGWMPAKVAIERVPQQIDAQLDPDPRRSPGYAPFLEFPADVAPAERERLAKQGEAAIRERVVPAFRKLREFYATRYLPAASESGAASRLPGGPAYYQALLADSTTTGMTAREIHELGLREVERIGKAMDGAMAESGFKGTRKEFQAFLNSDPKFFHSSAQEMLAGYRDIAKRADAQLPSFFAVLPRLPYGIRAMLPEEGDSAEHYTPGAADGTRAGYFEANVNRLSTRPKWRMESLLLHEAVPGHHLQISRAKELAALPEFRRNAEFTAYVEGWGLYAESLGYEMGFYADPYSRFGALSLEMHRACRLVVDTGLHAFGWTRDRAIEYLEQNAAATHGFAVAEVDRYLVWPGQATSYKLGELRIKALRAKAKAALGERFDLRRFHNAVLDNGALPLAVLEQQIDAWIAAEQARR